MNELTISIYVLGGLGLLLGLMLAYLSKRFEVEKNPKIAKVRELLPGINCGSCGYAGCDPFAEALINDNEDYKKCKPGKSKHDQIAQVLGKDVVCSTDRLIAKLYCDGDCDKTSDRFDYKGIAKCSTAAQVAGGPKSCSYGCEGYGDCVLVCPVGAITMNDKRLPVVDENKCIGCGKCVEECPKKLFELVPINKKVYVKCVSRDGAKDVVKNCKVGCINCKICEKVCPHDAIHVKDNIAKVDYPKCTLCDACVNKCPRKIIIHTGKKLEIKETPKQELTLKK